MGLEKGAGREKVSYAWWHFSLEMEKCAKSEAAASLRRCAKAALLLHSLNSTISQDQEKWKREIHDLKRELLKERFMRKKMKLCAFTELFAELLLLLSVWTFVLFYFL
ncbi:hypothetical protein HKD37_13G036391 [Glycine soja]